ncbi:hypothetical protein COCON_G00013120 [Conger conger]|uniref:Major facilitator superfamily (MFS) profile domain-containing protein n=1 Tax=Conger conger TaxID=82655 RepID=A0A9Q1E310_CONCO|nr:hypothetical protein COCON_G00013120 [Conger conger]
MPGLRERLRGIFAVEPVLFFFMTSTFIVFPAFQQLVIAKVCNEMFPTNTTVCDNPRRLNGNAEIQRRSSFIILAYSGTLSLVSIPPALMLGSWSDQGGRRLGMVLPSLLALVGNCIFIAMAVVESASVYWCVAVALVTGISGSHVSVFLSCFSYVADVADASSRTRRLALAESMVFIGGTVGFLFSGYLLQNYKFLVTFSVCGTFHLISILYVLLCLPSPDLNTLAEGQEEEDGPSLLMHVGRSFRVMLKNRPDNGKQKLYFLVICTFLNNVIVIGEQSILLLYLTYKPREFTTEMYGVFNSTRMLLLGFSLMGIFPLLLRYFGEMTLAKMSAFFRTASYVLMAFSTNTWMVFLVAVVGAPSGIPQAVIRSLSSAIVDLNEQGAMFSFMASMEALCIIVSAVLFNGIYPLTLTSFPGMVFIVMAGFAFISLIFIQWISEMPTTQPLQSDQD